MMFRVEVTRATYDSVARGYADEITHELDGLPVDAGLSVVAVDERDPYAPEVEYQSGRAHVTAPKVAR